MSYFASGIQSYVEVGNDVMPFGYHRLPLNEQRKMFANYATCLLYTSPSPRDRG